jgi:hypothetical protein
VVEEVQLAKELFFTEADAALVAARRALADWSLPRAAQRVAAAKQLQHAPLGELKVWRVLCCAVLCAGVLCCAPVCCAVLCCAVLCCAVLCCAVLCCAVLCCAVLCCAVCTVLCCAVM